MSCGCSEVAFFATPIIGLPMTDAIERHTVAMHFVSAAVAHLQPAAKERALAVAGIPAHLLDQPKDRKSVV